MIIIIMKEHLILDAYLQNTGHEKQAEVLSPAFTYLLYWSIVNIDVLVHDRSVGRLDLVIIFLAVRGLDLDLKLPDPVILVPLALRDLYFIRLKSGILFRNSFDRITINRTVLSIHVTGYSQYARSILCQICPIVSTLTTRTRHQQTIMMTGGTTGLSSPRRMADARWQNPIVK